MAAHVGRQDPVPYWGCDPTASDPRAAGAGGLARSCHRSLPPPPNAEDSSSPPEDEEGKKEGVDGVVKNGDEKEKVEGEVVEGSVVKKVEAVVKASVLGANAGGKEKETVVEERGVVGKVEGDENVAPEVEA